MSAYYVPGIVLGDRDRSVCKTKNLCTPGIRVGKQTKSINRYLVSQMISAMDKFKQHKWGREGGA